MHTRFNHTNFHQICDVLAKADADLAKVINTYGYPPFWSRPNTFETLVHIILEQQVSLASALSALNRLKEKTGDLSPENLLLLTDDDMRACYCSRQKTSYIRHLAEAICNNSINLQDLENQDHVQVRKQLTTLKGIGNWTTDVYLMFVLQHPDIFPIGDLAAVNGLKRIKNLAATTTKEDLLEIVNHYQPYRTLATMIVWHFYLSVGKKKV
jgi:DNA-3-methyladenine glycosylase II